LQLIGMPSIVKGPPKSLLCATLVIATAPHPSFVSIPISPHPDLRVTTETLAEEGGKLADKAQHQMQSLSLNQGQNPEVNVYREHKLDAWKLERNYTLAVESRHGIIGTDISQQK